MERMDISGFSDWIKSKKMKTDKQPPCYSGRLLYGAVYVLEIVKSI